MNEDLKKSLDVVINLLTGYARELIDLRDDVDKLSLEEFNSRGQEIVDRYSEQGIEIF